MTDVSVGVLASSVVAIDQSDTDQEVLEAAERLGFIVYNESGADLYLLLGEQAATTSLYTVKIADGGYYESPWGWDGPVHVIWGSAGSGKAMLTEVHG